MNRKERRKEGKRDVVGPPGITLDMCNALKRYLRERGCPEAAFILITPSGAGGNGDMLRGAVGILRAVADNIEKRGYQSVTPLEEDPVEN